MTTLPDWLQAHGLEQLAPVFAENDVDLATLMILSERDLEELGISFGMRKRLLAAIRHAQPAEAAPEDQQRRHLTVLFCDIVGYTKLSASHDPEILLRIVSAYEELCAACLARYQGFLFQRLGDGIVAFFGYPQAHEREAERAIRAGLDILDGVRTLPHPLEVRIGVANGIVLVSGGGRAAVGEAMNLAARLQTAAEPGTIIVSSSVMKLAGAAFRYAAMGDVDLKGFARPVPVFRVEALADTPAEAAAASATRPVGRDDELAGLLAVWQEICRTGQGRIAGISGEPGIGKSRLSADLCAAIVTPDNRFIRFQCSPFHQATPLHPVIGHFESLLEFTRDVPDGERLARIEGLVCGRHGLPPPDVRFIAALLSVPYAERFGEITEPPRLAKAETLRILLAMIASAASAAPAVLLIEDLHWADPTTREALDLLVGRLDRIAVFVVATYRPEFKPGWAAEPRVSLVPLTRLNAEQSRALILSAAGGRALPAYLEAMIAEKTDGVPLFIEELTRTLIDSGQIALAGDRFVQAGGNVTVALPDTLRASLTARLDRLVKAKRVAQIGAVIGRSFSRESLAALSDIDAPQLDEALGQLVSSGLAYREQRAGGGRYVFKHALVQDAAYDTLLLSQRRTLHNRFAGLLVEQERDLAERQPELIAHHLSAAGAEDKALPLWLKAADIAMQRFAISEAASHLRKGLSQIPSIPPSPERDILELRYRAALGPVLVAERGWGHPELSTVLEPAWTLAEAARHRESFLPILNSLWVHTMSIDKLALSMVWAERMRACGEEMGDSDLVIVAHRAISGSAYWQGSLGLARRHGDLLKDMYDPKRHWHLAQLINTDPLTGEAVYRGMYLWMLGYPDQAIAASNARDEHARRRGHPFDLAFALTLGAQVFELLKLPDELERRAEEANAVGRKYGVSLFFEMMGEITLGVAWLRAGRFAEAAEQIDRGVTRLAATGHGVWLSYLRALRGEALAQLGDIAAARQVIDGSIAHIEAGEERCHYSEVLRLRGWVAECEGDTDGAEALFRRAIAVAQSQEAKSWELRSTMSLAALLAGRGQAAEAHAMLAAVHGWFSEGFETHDLKAAAQLLSRLSAAT